MRLGLLMLVIACVGCDDGERERQNHQIKQLLGENEALNKKLAHLAERERACDASLGEARREREERQLELEKLRLKDNVGAIGDTGVVNPEQAHGQPPTP